MNHLKQRACCVLGRVALLLVPLAAPAQDAVDAGDAPQPASVLMLAAGLMVAGCMRRREHDFGE